MNTLFEQTTESYMLEVYDDLQVKRTSQISRRDPTEAEVDSNRRYS